MSKTEVNRVEKPLSRDDLHVGEALPWPIYSSNGSLLLPKGTVLNNGQQIERLLSNNACYYVSIPQNNEEPQSKKEKKRVKPVTTFMVVQRLLDQLKEAFGLIHDDQDTSFPNRILRLAQDLQEACNVNSDGIVGTMLLIFDVPHGIEHALHNATLCEVVCRRMGKGPLDRLPVVAAALTHDIGMYEIAQELFEQSEPLTPDQKRIIKSHPRQGWDILKSKGVTETRWLDAVLHHHERLDGSGYPDGITDDQISLDARLLAITDNYTALIRPRAYRSRVQHKDVLKQMLLTRGSSIDGELMTLFINAIGIYSPGTLVKLESGVIGIVTGHSSRPGAPKVALLTDKSGSPLDTVKTINTDEYGEKITNLLCVQEHRHLINNLDTLWPMIKQHHPSHVDMALPI